MSKFRAFLQRKNIIISPKRYFIDAMSAMAQGLFCTLLVGTILDTLGSQLHLAPLTAIVATYTKGDAVMGYTVGGLASAMVGPAMAVAIGAALGAGGMVLFSLVPVGFAANAMGGAGGPLAVFVAALVAAEFGKAVSKETKVDILVTPLVTILVGVGLSRLIAAPIGAGAGALGDLIMWATELQPFFMGILVSVIVGVVLTLPISSAAICSVLGLTGLAGGAAVAGCCAQMVGFAVLSFRENRWGGLVSQGIGTSMLQMGNIIKNPRVWIPPTLASAITGPIATCLFHLEMNGAPVNSGMGTCGFCGPIGVWTGWVEPSARAAANGAVPYAPGAIDWLGLLLVCIVLPALLSSAFGALLRRAGWIREGDLRL
ncbi:MAG: PTS sugar transporter subunit IIC [Oscillospiraceae bacterium]|nr:PTS sugar transporter subunit IIC [Oscillospiraceae bacterium]